MGLNAEEILTVEAFANPNATVIWNNEFQKKQIRQLSIAVKDLFSERNPREIKMDYY
jgi:hypothetical protein